MIWDSRKIAQYLDASHPDLPALDVQHILFDSRKYNAASNSIFFALRGAHHNGHDYIKELYHKGLRLFVIEGSVPGDFQDALFLQVDDSLAALQSLAKAIREHAKPRLMAITGSNGKTIVKEWLYQLLAQDFKTYRSPKSYNSQIGVPLSVWGMPEDTNLGLFEAGISMPGEMQKLAEILRPGGVFSPILARLMARTLKAANRKFKRNYCFLTLRNSLFSRRMIRTCWRRFINFPICGI